MLRNITQYLDNSARKYPDKAAFEDANGSITFRELFEKARDLAGNIAVLTEGRQNLPIAVYLPKSVDCIICFMAAAYSGNFYTPLDISMPLARLEKILDVLKPFIILTEKNSISTIKGLSPQSVCIDIEQNLSFEAPVELLQQIDDRIIDTDPLYVMFTSGSTGIPKGVVITHRAVIDYAEWLADTFSFSDKTVFGNQAPFYFDNSVLDIYSTLRNGAKTVIIPEEKFLLPVNLCKYLDEKKINTIFWVPSALVLVANSKALEKYIPQFLQNVLFCGEVMPARQLNIWIKHLPGSLYANLYGPTEITDVCTYFIVDRVFKDDEPLPIGFPCKNTGVLVLNEDNSLAEGDETGELCIKGTCLSSGYYKDAGKTEKAFVQNPLNPFYPEKIYRTGDLVYYNKRGELEYVGRKDYQIKHMGNRIELGEIEAAAMSFDGLTRCCAIYNEDKKKILLIVSPDSVGKMELYQCLKHILPHYMLPAQIETMNDLPLNQNGKIDRVLLRSRFC
jgi:amino acid adenylation domain-containing protein